MKNENKKKLIQCPYCIGCRVGQQRLANHIVSAHPKKVEEWIHGE